MNELTVLEVIAIICVATGFLLIAFVAWALVRAGRYELPEPLEEDACGACGADMEYGGTAGGKDIFVCQSGHVRFKNNDEGR